MRKISPISSIVSPSLVVLCSGTRLQITSLTNRKTNRNLARVDIILTMSAFNRYTSKTVNKANAFIIRLTG